MEGIVAAEAKVKEEEAEDEVVEVEVEEMVEETVKEEVEEKVVEEKAVGAGQWLRVFGDEGGGGHPRRAMEPSHGGWPPPPKPGPPPPRPRGESGLDSPFFHAAGASKDFGAGEVGMGGRGGGRPPGQAPARGGASEGGGGCNRSCPCASGGRPLPPRKRG